MSRTTPLLSSQDVVSIQLRPEPIKVRLIHLPIGRPTSTAVLRQFDPSEVGRCARCRHCTADADGECLVGVNRVLAEAEARDLTDRDCDWFEVPGRREAIRARSS